MALKPTEKKIENRGVEAADRFFGQLHFLIHNKFQACSVKSLGLPLNQFLERRNSGSMRKTSIFHKTEVEVLWPVLGCFS